MHARDVMTTDVVTASPDTTAREIGVFAVSNHPLDLPFTGRNTFCPSVDIIGETRGQKFEDQ